MPTSKKSARKRRAKPVAQDTARRLNRPDKFGQTTRHNLRTSVGPKGGRPPRFPGRTGGR